MVARWKASISTHRKAYCNIRWRRIRFFPVRSMELGWVFNVLLVRHLQARTFGWRVASFLSLLRISVEFRFLQIIREF